MLSVQLLPYHSVLLHLSWSYVLQLYIRIKNFLKCIATVTVRSSHLLLEHSNIANDYIFLSIKCWMVDVDIFCFVARIACFQCVRTVPIVVVNSFVTFAIDVRRWACNSKTQIKCCIQNFFIKQKKKWLIIIFSAQFSLKFDIHWHLQWFFVFIPK